MQLNIFGVLVQLVQLLQEKLINHLTSSTTNLRKIMSYLTAHKIRSYIFTFIPMSNLKQLDHITYIQTYELTAI